MTVPIETEGGNRTRLGWAAAVAVALCLTGCRGLLDRSSPAPPVGPAAPDATDQPILPPSAFGPNVAPVAAPPTLVVTGRLVDGVTGLPVRDAGVALLGLERRTISGPDGGFRFDGVKPGPVTVVLGPVEDYVTRGVDVHPVAGASDLGALRMRPADPPTLIVPEYGGVVTGCGETALTFASRALSTATPVRVTCLDSDRELPAQAPAGRLPLAAVDLSPGILEPTGFARLRVALPRQPRYDEGVPLDLLRLDLDRLIWIPTTTLVVDPGAETATGELGALGTYLVVAPPYGTFGTGAEDEPTIAQFRIAGEPDGPPADVHPAGAAVVYASFDYAGMDNTTITVRTTTSFGAVAFEQERPYADEGRDNVPMTVDGGDWPAGVYVTSLYVGDPPVGRHSITWEVTDQPTAMAPTASLPSAAGGDHASGFADPTAAPRSAGGACTPPAGWYAYRVLPGDTLVDLAARTGISVPGLMAANCLARTSLYAGEILYVPRPPSRRVPAAPPDWPSAPEPWATVVPRPQPTARYAPTFPPPSTAPWPGAPARPTPWYTPQAPAPPKPSPVPATLAPRPTVPEPPAFPTEPPVPPTEPPTGPSGPGTGAEPTAKWPTLPPEPAP